MGGEVARAAQALGKPGMPWQRDVWDIGLEYELVDGVIVPAYREVIVTVMRQSGKTTLVAALMAHRCMAWRRQPQRAIYTAQTGQHARAKLFEDIVPLYERSKLFKPHVSPPRGRVYRGIGPFEGVNWSTGSTIRMIGSAEDAGHGATETGLALIDESFADKDERREQALSPGMVTVRDAQTWNTSTAGTEASFFLRRKIEYGRRAAERGDTSGVCYVEYSIPDDANCDDPEVWWEFMPALGWTADEATIAHERSSMTDNAWRRAYGNQWTSAEERVIPAAVWQAAATDRLKPVGDLVFAVEVHPDRERSSIVACGGNVLELVASERGVDWVVAKLAELKARHGGRVRLDGAGPAAALLADLDRARVDVDVLSSRDVVRACGAFYDALVDGRLHVRVDGRLDAAAAAVTRRTGEAWCWSRRSPKTDVTPIMALSLAAPLPPAPVRRPKIHTLKEAST